MKKLLLLVCWLLISATGIAQTLEQMWKNPPAESRSWNYWYWLYGAISREGITADLEAMKANGIGGAYLFTIKGTPEEPFIEPSYTQLTPEWWQMVKFAIEEADRIGIDIAFHACDGWALAGGPWITPELSMQEITWSDTQIEGGEQVRVTLPRPPAKESYYRDIAIFAYPAPPSGGISTDIVKPIVRVSTGQNVDFLTTKDNKKIFVSKDPCWIEYAFDKPFLCRTIQVLSPKLNYQAQRMTLQASNNGVDFRTIVRMEPPRQSWYRRVPATTHAIPPTKARYFRLCYDNAGSEPGIEDMDPAKWQPELIISGIRFSSDIRIHQFEGKNGEVWRHAPQTTQAQVADIDCIDPKTIVNISQFVDAQGLLDWKAPAGAWTILRMGHTTNGKNNGPAGAASGLECDKMNPEAIRLQFDSWFGQAKRIVGPELFSRVVKLFHVDSWECGNQNWSPVFREEFRTRRGYDILPYLPVIAGIPVGSIEQTERLLYDVRQTISEVITDNFFGIMQQCAHDNGCGFSAECVAPVTMSDGMMHYKNTDIPMGEFWLRSPTHDKPNDILDAVSGAHIYGKRIIGAEAFTEVDITWDEHPGMLKALQDFQYANGINRLVFHVNVHNPWPNRKPGMTLDGIGLYFQRDQTWWKMSRAWMDYATRCQALLQAGVPVVDLAVFTGDDLPRRALLPERLVSWFPGLFGTKTVEQERTRLANEGIPMITQQSGRTYTANMTHPQAWVNPMHGYSYDSFNPDALLNLAKAENGRIVLPDGMSYSALVIPGEHSMMLNAERISKKSADKIDELARQGVPVFAASLPDKTFSTSETNKKPSWSHAERFIPLPYSEQTLDPIGIARDFTVTEQDGSYGEYFAYRHRRTPEAEIYFIANQSNKAREVTIALRATNGSPEIWLPASGEVISATEWRTEKEQTIMPMQFAPYESVFVVLRNSQHTASISGGNRINPIPCVEITTPWHVNFDPEANGPNSPVNFPTLTDWSTHTDPKIKYYSGTAVYTNHFVVAQKPNAGKRYFVELEGVYNLAEIRINGQKCGIVWTPPYRVEITEAMLHGKNTIEIAAVNTWANRIRGDREASADNRRPAWTIVPYSQDKVPMQPSGLTGYVRISSAQK